MPSVHTQDGSPLSYPLHCLRFCAYIAYISPCDVECGFLTDASPVATAWINNCVGHFNHRYFMLFLIYLWGGCVYVAYNVYDLFWLCMSPHSSACRRATDSEILVLASFALVVSVILGVGVLLGSQVLLVSRGQTSIEDLDMPTAHSQYGVVRPYDAGLVANWRAFFGVRKRWHAIFILLPWPRDPTGDGYRWRSFQSATSALAFDV
eukprot:Opistho-2@75123